VVSERIAVPICEKMPLIDKSAVCISGKKYWTEIREKKHKLWAFIFPGENDLPAKHCS
jgi:hypothetical protein